MKFLSLTACLVMFLGMSAQFSPNQIIEIVEAEEAYQNPEFMLFSEDDAPTQDDLSIIWSTYLKASSDFGFILNKTEVDELGYTHLAYKQSFNGIPLAFSDFKVHLKNGKIISINGKWINKEPATQNKSLSENDALEKALAHIGAKVYKWQVELEEKHIKTLEGDLNATYFPKGELVYVSPKAKLNPNEMELAYQFNIYAHEPHERVEIYVSANNGNILFKNDLIHTGNASGTARTAYSGNQSVTTDSTGLNQFRLRQTASGGGVQTFDLNNATTYGGAVDFTDTDNFWNNVNNQQDQYATDAHWGAERTYDYFFNKHNRNSINNAGFTLVSYVHYDNNYANAFWNGQYMTYGDGSGAISPLTALDIAGHEITHGLTTFSANLVYQSESGALNESFSDIFGAAIEFYARPNNANWTIGEDIGRTIRSMSNPAAFGDPDTRNGNNWLNVVGCTPSNQNDNCGVHINSGVQNFWFYLLVNGGSGVNDLGNAYSVSGIGIDKAAAIAFRNLTVYLGRTSDYDDARLYAIRSAIDLYGACSPEVAAVTNAWYAVGVGAPYVAGVNSEFFSADTTACAPPFQVAFQNNSSNGVTYTWDFGDGSTSTQANPVKTYTAYGQFDVELIVDGGNCGADTLKKQSYIKVDSSYQCVVLLNSGINPTQTTCTGKLFDSGGSTSNYGDNENGFITIAPPGANSVTLNFISFDVEAGSASGLCDYDFLEIFDGASISSPSLGKFCNTSAQPTTVSSTTGVITIRFSSDQFLTEGGFEIDWSCNYPSSPPNTDFRADVTSTCTGVVEFTDESTQLPTAWTWDFGDGTTSTMQNPIHQYQQNGSFTIKLVTSNNFGADSISKSNLVTVSRPPEPQTNGDTVCIGQSTTVSAQGSGILNWYDQAQGGNLLYSGNNFSTPNLVTSKSYFVEDYLAAPSQSVGPANNNFGGGGFGSFDRHLVFDVFQPLILESVTAYANSSGNRLIELRDNNGVVLQSTSVFLSNGMNVINLNFNLNVGSNFQLGIATGGTINLYRTNAGLSYPYTIPSKISIKGSNASVPTSYYYYFYNWQVKDADCYSPRKEVSIFVDSSCSITGLNEEKINNEILIYPNPATNQFNVQLSAQQTVHSINLFDLAGKKVNMDWQKVNDQFISVNGINEVNGIYILQISTEKGIYHKKITLIKR
tara:strand:- start:3598 stop:7098 length:3501 start_codon:yes stop_codon:yes gene_type:complete